MVELVTAERDEPIACLTCGSDNGVYSDDEVDPHWTCLECGDEWPLDPVEDTP